MRNIGEAVVYVDELRKQHPALLTAIHGEGYGPEKEPTVNLTFVSDNEAEHDGYGRQIKRESSVAHCSNNGVYGRCWISQEATRKAQA